MVMFMWRGRAEGKKYTSGSGNTIIFQMPPHTATLLSTCMKQQPTSGNVFLSHNAPIQIRNKD